MSYLEAVNRIKIAAESKDREVDLSNLDINEVPPDISKLAENIERINLSNNKISVLPNIFGNFIKLQSLYLSHNQLRELPTEIGKLVNLRVLYLDNNEIEKLTHEIGKLVNLNSLYLHNNKLRTLPKEIGNLRELNKLDIQNNHIQTIPSEVLDIDLQINVYETEIWKENYIGLYNNPIKTPPIEIIHKGKSAIRAYYKSIEGKKQPLNEAKILLVGKGLAGKTSLVKRITANEFDVNEPQTDGINIKDWRFSSASKYTNVRFWDFGGQEIMHATHQFFLTQRSLYILVLDARDDTIENAEYWLKHVQTFGGSSPVLIVINKIDENPGFGINTIRLKEKYGNNIKEFYKISCMTGDGIDNFVRKLKLEIANLDLLTTVWAESWFKVKEDLDNMNEFFIGYEKYQQLCRKHKIKDELHQETLVEFLNDLGIIVYFSDFGLDHTQILNPEWITNAVYAIVNSDIVANKQGILELQQLSTILESKQKEEFIYPRMYHNYIIKLMGKFEICYEIDKNSILIPDLLPVDEPSFSFDYDDAIKFHIDYDFLPKLIMPRFIVHMHHEILDNLQWRTGVVLKNYAFNASAVIKADDTDKNISIYVSGQQKSDYFAVVLHTLREINKSFKNLKFSERVVLPDKTDDENFISVSYEHLIKLEELGVNTHFPEGAKKEYKVNELLGRVITRRTTESDVVTLLEGLIETINNKQEVEKTAEKILILQPNWFGLGIDLRALVNKVWSFKEK